MNEEKIKAFNKTYTVGDKVRVWKTKGVDHFEDEIKFKATILGGHTPVMWLKQAGSYDLTFMIGKI